MTMFTDILRPGRGVVFRNPFPSSADQQSKASDTSNVTRTFHRYNELPKELKEMIVSYALTNAVKEPSTAYHHAAMDRANPGKYFSAKLDMFILSSALANSSDRGDELIAPLKQLDHKLNTEVKQGIALREQHHREVGAIRPEGDEIQHLRDLIWKLEVKVDEVQEAQRRLGCTQEDLEYLWRTKRDARNELARLQRDRDDQQGVRSAAIE